MEAIIKITTFGALCTSVLMIMSIAFAYFAYKSGNDKKYKYSFNQAIKWLITTIVIIVVGNIMSGIPNMAKEGFENMKSKRTTKTSK